MLTAYDAMTASVFDEAGIPVLLVGDSAGNCHLGYDTTVPVTLDQMAMLSAAVVRGTRRALIVADLPFGSYQEGPAQALRSATRLVKEAGVGAVKLEGGERSHEQIRLLVESGIPVMAHIGLTPSPCTPWATASRGAARRPPSSCCATRSPCRTRAPSRWCWSWCPPSWRRR